MTTPKAKEFRKEEVTYIATAAVPRLEDVYLMTCEINAEVDRERGWADADGEPVGHGETFAGLAFAMRWEIFGTQGKE